MRISLGSDANWETRTGRISRELNRGADFFLDNDYGSAVVSLGLVFMCRDPSLVFKRRARYEADKAQLYVDIMLDYEKMLASSMIGRMEVVVDSALVQLTDVLRKRVSNDFDVERFLEDFRSWLQEMKAAYDGHGSGAWKY